MPAPLFQQLAEGGRVVVPVGGPQSQVLHVVEKIDGRMRLSTRLRLHVREADREVRVGDLSPSGGAAWACGSRGPGGVGA